MKTYRMSSFGTYTEGVGTLKAAGGDLGGGSETLVMTYQKVTGPLMANSHPGSYCGQDAYSDMLITGGSDNVENVERYGGSSDTQYTQCRGGATNA